MNTQKQTFSSNHISYFFALMMGAALSFSPLATPIKAQTTTETGRLVVKGMGEISRRPDMAQLRIGVTEEAGTASIAMEGAAVKAQAMLITLQEAGIADEDIQTGSIRLDPVYQPFNNNSGQRTRQIIAYNASYSFNIKLRQLELLGPVLDGVLQSGSNQMGGLQLTLADPEPVKNSAREAAIADARARAELYAAAAGVTLGDIRLISEVSAASHPQAYEAVTFADSASAGRGNLPLATGEITIHSEIHMEFEILP